LGPGFEKAEDLCDKIKPKVFCLDFFEFTNPKYYGIQSVYLPKSWEKGKIESVECVGVISVTSLEGLHRNPGSYDWLQGKQPFGTVGRFIYLYDFQRTRVPRWAQCLQFACRLRAKRSIC